MTTTQILQMIDLAALILSGNGGLKIHTIKIIREMSKILGSTLSLMESKNIVDAAVLMYQRNDERIAAPGHANSTSTIHPLLPHLPMLADMVSAGLSQDTVRTALGDLGGHLDSKVREDALKVANILADPNRSPGRVDN